MTARRLYIGGVSQSGKTTVSARLADLLDLPHVDIDLDPVITLIRTRRRFWRRRKFLQWRSRMILARTRGPGIIDCPYLPPLTVVRPRFGLAPEQIAYFGYPEIEIDAKIAQLEADGFCNANHLSQLDPDALRRMLIYFRHLARRDRDQCARLGLVFYDMSDPEARDTVQARALDEICALLAQVNGKRD